MFKWRQNKKEHKGIVAAPYSSVPGCIGAIILVIFAIWSFLNLTEVVKWVGTPFMILPDALGLVDRPTKDEVARVSGLAGSEHVVVLTRTGRYNLFRNSFDEVGVELGEYAPVRIEGPDGRVSLFGKDRGAWFFDTPAGRGTVTAQFEINQPGQYLVRFEQTEIMRNKTFETSLVPDYLTGHLTELRWAFVIQIAIILIIPGAYVYTRKIKPMQAQIMNEFKVQDKKRDSMDDFLHELKKDSKRLED